VTKRGLKIVHQSVISDRPMSDVRIVNATRSFSFPIRM